MVERVETKNNELHSNEKVSYEARVDNIDITSTKSHKAPLLISIQIIIQKHNTLTNDLQFLCTKNLGNIVSVNNSRL